MKCKRCRTKAEVHIRHHNAAFCRPCYVGFFQRQVERAIDKASMMRRQEKVLVAVSGGKDSLALWHVLAELGFDTTGLHVGLGIGEYSQLSLQKTEAFAAERGLPLLTVSLAEAGVSVPAVAAFTNRPACAACGASKRYHFDRIAHEHGFAVLATGHNLDDEAARLLGNVMRWQVDRLAKQHPVLEPTHERFARKVKPLFRLTEYETAVYAFFCSIDYVVEECPNSAGATQLAYKDALNRLEATMPGSKLSFVQEFLRRGQPRFASATEQPPSSCERCGMPAYASLCSYCSLMREVESKQPRGTAANRL